MYMASPLELFDLLTSESDQFKSVPNCTYDDEISTNGL